MPPHESEAVRAALDRHALVMVCDRDGVILDANTGMCEVSGYSLQELVGQHSRLLSSGEHPQEFWVQFWQTVRAGKSWHGEFCNCTKHGRLFWVDCTVTPVLDRAGAVQRLVSIQFDITARKLSERTANESNRLFTTLVNAMAEGVVMQAPDGRIIASNPAAERVLGLARGQLAGEMLADGRWNARDEDGRPLPGGKLPPMVALGAGRDIRNATIQISRADGSTAWLRVNSDLIRNEHGRVVSVVSSFAEITSERAAQGARDAIELQFRALVNNFPGVAFRHAIGEPAVPIFISQGVERLTGYPVSDFMDGRCVLADLTLSEDLGTVRRVLADAVQGLSAYSVEYRLVHRSGEVRWVHECGQVVGEPGTDAAQYIDGMQFDITDRKRAEHELLTAVDTVNEERGRLELALESGGLGLWDWSPPTGRVVLDQRWALMLGINADDEPLSIDDWVGRIHPDDAESSQAALESHFQGLTDTYECEHRLRHRDGTWRWVQSRGKVVSRDERGRPTRMVGTHCDVTEELETERRLAESEERFRSLADAAPMLIWTSGQDARREYFNIPWFEFRGRTGDQELGDGWTEGVHPEDRARCVAAHLKSLRERAPFEIEYRLLRFDGEYRVFSERGVPRYDGNGTFVGFIGVCVDVTERRAAEQKLEESERRTRAIIEGADVIAWEFDVSADAFTYVSPQAAKLGFAVADWFAPGFWRARVHSSDRPAAHVEHGGTSDVSRHHRVQYRVLNAAGEVMWVDAFASRETRADGTLILRGVFIDATEARRLRDAAESANLSKSMFLANMSHEIRTPLTAILGYSDLLVEDGDLSRAPERRLQTITTIRQAGEHLLTIVNDILDISKIEAGRMTIEHIETDLPALLGGIDAMLRARAEGKGIAFEVKLVTQIPERLLTDPTRLRQILLNLIGNAVKFTELGRVSVSVRAPRSEETLVFEIEDTGPGMTQEQAARLFQPFSQADASVTRSHGGTGLGLVICRRLANLMGGNVELTRSDVGKGSVFVLTLPRRVPDGTAWCESLARTQMQDSHAAIPSKLNGRVLLVEDGPDNQKLIAFHLRRAGLTVEIADNGVAALDALARERAKLGPSARPYDIILSDMQMPEMDGYTLARTLRERGDAVPIIALTAHAMADERAKCLAAGCDDYSTKPIDKKRLIEICASWLGRSSPLVAKSAA